MTEPLEAVTTPVEPAAQPTPLEQAAAKGEDFSLKDFRKARETAVDEPLEVVQAPEVKEIGEGEAKPVTEPVRDEHGRFVKTKAEEPVVAATPVEDEDDETKPIEVRVSGWQKRLNREVAKRGEIERREAARVERLTRQIEELQAKLPAPAIAPAVPAKTAEKFQTYDEWVKTNADGSYEDYIRASVREEIDAKLTAERQRLEADSRDRAAAGALHTIESLGAQSHADFKAVMQAADEAGMRWAPHITEFVMRQTETAQEAVDLTYTLLKDAALVDRLNRLPPARAVYELGRLVSSGASSAQVSEPLPSPVTKAPAPIRTVGTNAIAPAHTLQGVVKAGPEISLSRYRQLKQR